MNAVRLLLLTMTTLLTAAGWTLALAAVAVFTAMALTPRIDT